VSFSGKEKPDQKGHRAFLAGRVKNMIVGEKLNWSVFLSLYLPLRKTLPRVIYIIKPKNQPLPYRSVTKKNFEGVSMSSWGVVTKVRRNDYCVCVCVCMYVCVSVGS
jgi:hypothetical protein